MHVQPGFAALLTAMNWAPKNAHAVKLDTYFQKVRLGERLSAAAAGKSPGFIRVTKAQRPIS